MAAPEGCHRERYLRLLRATDLNPEAVLSAAQDPVRPAQHGLLTLAQCLARPQRLVRQIRQECPQDEPGLLRARLSVLQQDLALQVIAPLVLQLFRDQQAPVPDPDRILLAPADPQPPSPEVQVRWYMLPGSPLVEEREFVRETGKRLRAWYPLFRNGPGISAGAWWSSMGLALGAPYSAIWDLAAPAQVCTLANAWLEEFGEETARYIDWIPWTFNGRPCALPQRRGCCLKFRLPGGSYCGTCGVYRRQRLQALNSPSGEPASEPAQPVR